MAEYRISLENISLYGYHGASANERELGQRFEIDVDIIADLSEAVATDDMKKTVNYEKVYRLVESEVVNEKYRSRLWRTRSRATWSRSSERSRSWSGYGSRASRSPARSTLSR
jgi:ribosomal protein L19E